MASAQQQEKWQCGECQFLVTHSVIQSNKKQYIFKWVGTQTNK
jgi:hypothetical protein